MCVISIRSQREGDSRLGIYKCSEKVMFALHCIFAAGGLFVHLLTPSVKGSSSPINALDNIHHILPPVHRLDIKEILMNSSRFRLA